MRIIEYRKVPFVDREKEEKWLLERFSQEPEKILFIYGPKSSSKEGCRNVPGKSRLLKVETRKLQMAGQANSDSEPCEG